MGIQTKHVASISLGIMGTGFLATLPFQESVIGTITSGGFEAGLVGGLADWFAVTALFRHPMGIPIPHTALLPRNRQRMTKGLINMLENEWLTKESITNKLKQIHVLEKLTEAFEQELKSEQAIKAAKTVLLFAIRQIDVDKLAVIAAKELKKYLHSFSTHSLLQSAIDQIILYNYEEQGIDYLLSKVMNWIENDTNRQKLGKIAMTSLLNIELDGFLQFAFKSFLNIVDEDKLGGIIQEFIRSGITSLQQDDNENRKNLLQAVRNELLKAKENEQLVSQIESWKEKFLSNWNCDSHIASLLQQIKSNLSHTVEESNFIENYVLPYLLGVWENIKNNPTYYSQMENWIHKQAATLIENNHYKIGKLVQENLDKLDNETLVSVMEQHVGKDLQWIRVNGAVCGFLIGICLQTIKLIF